MVRPIQIPAGIATLGAQRDDDRLRLGQRVRRASTSTVPAFDIDACRVTNARLPRVRRRRRLSHAASVGRRGLGVDCSEEHRVEHPVFWVASIGDEWLWRGMFEDDAAARRLARLRQPGGSVGLRALERAPADDRSRSSIVPRTARRRATSAASMGRRSAGRVARQLRFRGVRSGAGRIASGGRERVGRPRSGRQRVGVDVDGLRARSTGFDPMASYPEYSADFFDGQHYVMKGASPATATRAGAPQLPQLVPGQLPVCLREVPDARR